ncbi:MAG: M56 family metallopeptidase, partial [Acidobacteriaceae bacterium]
PAWLPAGIALAWGAACAYFAARFVRRWARLWSLRREAVALEGETKERWTRCAERLGMGDVAIAASTRVFGPVTMGLRRRLVLLPASMAEDLPEAEVCAVLTHELAHLRRNDYAKNLVYELVTLPVSWHPLLGATRERVAESREMICDAMAAGEQGRHAYARSLLRLAALLVEGAPVRTPHAIGIFDANTFERRLMRLTERGNEMRGVRRLAMAMLVAALGAGTCASAVGLSVHVDAATASTGQEGTPAGGTMHPDKVHVASGVMAGQRISGEMPVYPPEAKKKKVQGTVVLKATIDKDGNVEALTVVSGPKMLQGSSLDAVKTWKYKPYLLNGDPVAVETEIHVVYSLGK